MMINLKAIPGISDKNADKYALHLDNTMERFDIDTPVRICCFLGQVFEESGHLVYAKELASGVAYEGRKDLGNIQVGDGKRYRGRGTIQITGRANYASLSRDLGVDFIGNPELLEQPEYACLSAGWYWSKRKLNNFADLIDFTKPIDTGSNLTNYKELTRRINGGYTHLAQRLQNYKDVKAALFPVLRWLPGSGL